jgi:aminomethyltransferase
VYRTGEDVFLVVANAGNRDVAVAAMQDRAAGYDVLVTDDSDRTALVAIQGPAAAGTLDALVVADRLQPESPLDELRYYRVLHALFDGSEVLIARTGYTGEDGFELYSDTEVAPAARSCMAATATSRLPAFATTRKTWPPRAPSSVTPACSPPPTPACSSAS